MKLDVINIKGETVSSLELNPEIFASPVSSEIIHEVVKWQLAKRRAGTHATKNVRKMDNTNKKIYRQKGTGRARAGHRYSPTRVGGAVAHGPQPKSYEYKLNRKLRAAALKGALSDKCSSGQFKIVDLFKLSEARTRVFAEVLSKVAGDKHDKKVLFVVNEQDVSASEQITMAGRNLKKVKFTDIAGLNVYDLVNADCLICQEADIANIESRFTTDQESE